MKDLTKEEDFDPFKNSFDDKKDELEELKQAVEESLQNEKCSF